MQLRIPDPSRARAYFEDKMAFTLGPVELERAIRTGENITVVDVRASDDFAAGHIPGAINLPREKWDNPMGLDKSKTNIVYCYTQQCHLAADAARTLAAQGFPVMEMDGGFEAWKENDFEIEHEQVNRLKKAGGLFHWKH